MSTSTYGRVEPWKRARRGEPCPICEGHGGLPRHRSERCKGYLSEDERYYFCSREEYAGALSPNANGDYRHFLAGPCHCGIEHGGALPPITPRPPSEPRPIRPQSGPLPRTITDDDGATLTLAAEYAYRRAEGGLTYRVARYHYLLKPGEAKPDKTFRQFRQVDTTSWAWGLGETERVLYRLPELLAASISRPVFIVEGEKCAEAMAALGLVVTTCSEGARKWPQVTGRHDALRGRHVVILPDQDEAGRAHARLVAEDLAGVAASVRTIDLPGLSEHGDAVEWIAAGGTKDALYELVMTTPAHAPNSSPDGLPAQEPCPARQDDFRASNNANPRDALTIAYKRIEHLEAWQKWVRDSIADPNLSAHIKLARIAARDALDQQWRPDGAPKRVYLSAIAERYGVSAQSAGDHLRKLHDLRVLDYHVDRTTDANGMPRSQASIAAGPLLMKPREVAPDVPRDGWGGKRAGAGRKCKTCQSENLVKRTQIVCRDCGSVEALADVEVNAEPTPLHDAPAQTSDTPSDLNSCPASQDDFRAAEADDYTPYAPPTSPATSPPQDMGGGNLAPQGRPAARAARTTGSYFDWSGPRRDEPCPCGAPPQWGLIAGEPVCMKCGTLWKAEVAEVAEAI